MSDYKKPRRTKIVATLGPATDDPAVLEGLIQAGVDVVRLNFSHGHADEQKKRALMVKELSAKMTREELIGWIAFYELKNEEENKAMEKAQNKSRARVPKKR